MVENINTMQADIARQYSGIETMVSANVDNYLISNNTFIPRALVKAIKAFPDQQEAFQAWCEYLKNGDENKMKEFVGKQNFSAAQDLSIRQMFIKENHRESGKKTGIFNNAVMRGASNLLNWSLSPLLTKKISGLKLRNALFYSIFQMAKYSVKSPAMDTTPYKKELAPYIQDAINKKLSVDLQTLKDTAKNRIPLISLSDQEISELKNRATLETQKLYRTLLQQIEESQYPKPNSRKELSADYSQIPEDLDFGVEFEGFTFSKDTFGSQALKLNTRLIEHLIPVEKNPLKVIRNALLPKIGNYDIWSITRDSSVLNPLTYLEQNDKKQKSSHAGMEIVSRILTGPEGGKEVQQVISILKSSENGFLSNLTCGMHLHVSLEHRSLEQVKNLAVALVKNEKYIDELIHANRRGNTNPFAKSCKHADIEMIQNAKTITELVNIMCPNNDRDHKFNFTNLSFDQAPPTIEYRCEGGPGYINSALDFIVVITNFTQQALENPNVTLNQVLNDLDQSPISPHNKRSAYGIHIK